LTIIGLRADGRKITKPSIPATVGTGTFGITVRVSDFNYVDYILQVNLTTSPKTYAIPHDIGIEDNVIGLTVTVGAGTTVSGEIITQGR